MHNAHRHLVSRSLGACALAAALLVGATAPASAAVFAAQSLTVFRDGGPTDWLAGNNRLLTDSFDNGDPYHGPNFNVLNGPVSEYFLSGLELEADRALAAREQGGSLLLDPAYGAVSANALGQTGRSMRMRLLTITDDSNTGGGLARSRSFASSLRLSLAAMPDVGQSFGIRLTDNYNTGVGGNSDVIELSVSGGASGNTLSFRKQDFAAGTIKPLGAAPLLAPAGADSLVLVLSHPDANTDTIYGVYGYTDASGVLIGNLTSFNDSATAFQGELHTRIELRATGPLAAVPEPGVWALFAAGLGLLLALRTGRRQSDC